MKITKILNTQLLEDVDTDVETTIDIEETAPEVEPVENPASAPKSEIEDTIEAAVEAQTGENVVDAAVSHAADEVKATAKEIDAQGFAPLANNDSPLNTQNALTDMLDDALADVDLYAAQGRKVGSNCLVTGLPGSGKTAIVYDWAKAHNINILYLDSKNPDLETLINGFTLRDITAKDDNLVAQAFSKTLDPLDKPRSVLFLDELNRQTKPHIRASLLTLINEKCISGKDETGRRYFPNLLFTIACINPAVPTDKGAAALNDAEKSRFVNKLTFNSNSLTAFDYFTKYYNKLISNLDPTAPEYKDWYQMYKLEQALAIYIVSHPEFYFDTEADLEDLADQQKTILSQRSLTDGLAKSHGDANRLWRWIKNSSDFLQKDIDMFERILSSYTPPVIEIPNIPDENIDTANQKSTQADNEDSIVGSANTTEEDDAEFFSSASGLGSDKVVTPTSAESIITNTIRNW